LARRLFKVRISPECSGYEGIGLILAFLSVYLWILAPRSRFPGALLLLPLGAAAIWIINAVRIVLLIAIGTPAGGTSPWAASTLRRGGSPSTPSRSGSSR
jgi:exosortase/archaeosortase family protein